MVLLVVGGAQSASATALCKTTSTPCESGLIKGSEVTFRLSPESSSTIETNFPSDITCNSSHINTKVTNPGGLIETALAEVVALTFSQCNCTVAVLTKGTFEIHSISKTDNGTLKSTGAQITTICFLGATPVHCIYETNNTVLGTLVAGSPAKLNIEAATVWRLPTDVACGEMITWKAEYEVLSPNPLYVEPGGPQATTGAVLCTETTTPCPKGKDEGPGAEFSANLTAGTKWKLGTAYKNLECGKSSLKGEVTSTGGSGTLSGGELKSLSLEECNCSLTVLSSASNLSIEYIPGTDNGTIKASGTEVTTECSTLFGKVHCIYVMEGTDLTLTGGNPAGLETTSSELLTRSTHQLCDERAHLEAEYELTNPNPLYVEPG